MLASPPPWLLALIAESPLWASVWVEMTGPVASIESAPAPLCVILMPIHPPETAPALTRRFAPEFEFALRSTLMPSLDALIVLVAVMVVAPEPWLTMFRPCPDEVTVATVTATGPLDDCASTLTPAPRLAPSIVASRVTKLFPICTSLLAVMVTSPVPWFLTYTPWRPAVLILGRTVVCEWASMVTLPLCS